MNNLSDDLPPIISADKAGEILGLKNEQDLYNTLEKEDFAYQKAEGCKWKIITQKLDEWIENQL